MSNWCLKIGDLFLRQIDQSATFEQKLNESSFVLRWNLIDELIPIELNLTSTFCQFYPQNRLFIT